MDTPAETAAADGSHDHDTDTMDYPTDRSLALANAVQGKEIYYFFGNRVIEHTTSTGAVRALKVRSKKNLDQAEADLMQYACDHGITAPRVYGLYGIRTTYTIASVLVMNRAPGVALVDVWLDLSKEEQESIKRQLREQLAVMRACTQPFIGSINRRSAHNVYSRIVPERFGPFDSEEAFDEWCLARVKCMPLTRWRWKTWLKRMRGDAPSRFVLTHGDLTPRNIMVDGGKVTGIVDWERGGFFPEYCEYAWAMKLCHEHEEWWMPVLKEIMEPCLKERVKFTEMVEERGW